MDGAEGRRPLGVKLIAFFFFFEAAALILAVAIGYMYPDLRSRANTFISQRAPLLQAFEIVNIGVKLAPLFALVNIMLPILWSISNTLTTRVSGMIAFLGFLTLGYPESPSVSRRIAVVLGSSVLILGAAELARPFIPPAPLRLASVEFGTDFERESLRVIAPLLR